MPNIYDIAQQFKAALLDREREAAVRLVKTYGVSYARLAANLEKLLARMDAAKAKGEPITANWLFQQERYFALLNQIATEMAKFADVAGSVITKEQRAAVRAALNDSQRLLLASAEASGVEASFNRVPVSAVESLAGFLSNGSPLNSLLSQFGPSARSKVESLLIEGVANGRGPRDIARAMKKALGGNLARALKISRTETARAYNEATHRQFEANADVLEGWEWLAALNGRTCAACIALHGTFHETSERMASHVNCVIPGEKVVAAKLQGATERWYSGEVVEIHTINGHSLTVTPNHPILTPEGWTPAGLLNEGGDLFSSSHAERVLSAIYPDDNHTPMPIEQIVHSFRKSGGVFGTRMPSAPEDFHGDGPGSQVHVVYANGQLGNRFDAKLLKHFSQFNFVDGLMSNSFLPSHCPLHLFVGAVLSAAHGGMSSPDVGEVFFRRPGQHHQAVGFSVRPAFSPVGIENSGYYVSRDTQGIRNAVLGFTGTVSRNDLLFRQAQRVIVSQGQASFSQQSFDDFVGDAESAHQICARFAGLVKLDKIRKIIKRPFNGHVYNLQTELGWYTANGIITHNCRCVQIPKTIGSPARLERGADWFARQSEAVQRKVFDNDAAFDLFKAGKLRLEDFVGRKDSPQWGASYHRLSAKRALAGDGRFPG
jgi:SPP1 gp7 family putative phage head morphogenesis protein